jgi:hypothetical protein
MRIQIASKNFTIVHVGKGTELSTTVAKKKKQTGKLYSLDTLYQSF